MENSKEEPMHEEDAKDKPIEEEKKSNLPAPKEAGLRFNIRKDQLIDILNAIADCKKNIIKFPSNSLYLFINPDLMQFQFPSEEGDKIICSLSFPISQIESQDFKLSIPLHILLPDISKFMDTLDRVAKSFSDPIMVKLGLQKLDDGKHQEALLFKNPTNAESKHLYYNVSLMSSALSNYIETDQDRICYTLNKSKMADLEYVIDMVPILNCKDIGVCGDISTISMYQNYEGQLCQGVIDNLTSKMNTNERICLGVQCSELSKVIKMATRSNSDVKLDITTNLLMFEFIKNKLTAKIIVKRHVSI